MKIKDCINQEQPKLKHVIIDKQGKELATVKAPTFNTNAQAGNFAMESARAKFPNASKEELKELIRLDDVNIKLLSLSIESWCFDEAPTYNNVKEAFEKTTEGQTIFIEFIQFVSGLLINKEAIAKN